MFSAAHDSILRFDWIWIEHSALVWRVELNGLLLGLSMSWSRKTLRHFVFAASLCTQPDRSVSSDAAPSNRHVNEAIFINDD